MHVLILGGGAIGAALASVLARQGEAVTLVERHAVGGAASGKAGGFLARDWCDGTALAALARRSFDLHAEWAEARGGGRWGYRRLDTYAGAVRRRAPGRSAPLGWLADRVAIGGRLGGPDTTAQVHPALFTQAMMADAEAHGARLLRGEATGLLRAGDAVGGAIVDGEPVAADATVIALGPWSLLASRWLPLPHVGALKGHSVVLAPRRPVPAEALFLEGVDAGGALQPEVFPRADGTVYACAISSEAPLPLDPGAVSPDPGAIERLLAFCAALSPALAEAGVEAAQACHRPVTADGRPLIGALPGAPGAYVATGHGVWGILNAPGTAEALAGLVRHGASGGVDLAPFDPGRLPALDGTLISSVPAAAGSRPRPEPAGPVPAAGSAPRVAPTTR